MFLSISKKLGDLTFGITLVLLFSTYALQPSRLIVRSGLDVPNFTTRCLHASPRESTQRGKVELWARNVRKFCLGAEFHVTFGTDGFISPSERRRAEDFFFFLIRRLWRVVNPHTWVPKASTLPLDHRSRYV
jgi:hypothetical protein